MDELVQHKASESPSLQRMVETLQNSLHQHKIHIAQEVKNAVFCEISNSLGQQVSTGLEEMHRSYGSALDNLEKKLDQRISLLEQKVAFLETAQNTLQKNAQKVSEKLSYLESLIQNNNANYKVLEEKLNNCTEVNKNQENWNSKFYDALMDLNNRVNTKDFSYFEKSFQDFKSDILSKLKEDGESKHPTSLKKGRLDLYEELYAEIESHVTKLRSEFSKLRMRVEDLETSLLGR